MEFASINSPAAAFVAGLVTSLHCAGMCGPLACWLAPARQGEDATTLFSTYQGTRLASYGVLGAAAGGLGQVPLSWMTLDLLRFLPWLLVVFFVAVALRLDKRIPKPAFAIRWTLQVQAWGRKRSRLSMAAAMGAATPLLPCGPLYLVVTVAAFSGSVVDGAEFMLAFGLGSLPLLWLVQAQYGRWSTRFTPQTLGRVQAIIACAAALVIAWRLRGTLGMAGPGMAEWVCH